MRARSAVLRGLAVVMGALMLGACGGPAAEAGAEVLVDELALTTVDSSLGSCPGYDSCANWSPWYAVPGTTYCGEHRGMCGWHWVCEEDPWGCPGGVAPEAPPAKEGEALLPPCCGILYQEGNPATLGTQERYRVCFNPQGASCTDYEQTSGSAVSCGC
ncbi:hypothetical protein [Myxococcus stipitatus]|nr:hypothetical protein [Myxococcus stipitatus]